MTLAQPANFFEAEAKSQNIWESIEHDWMVVNIATMAETLQDFVSTYAQAGTSLIPYEALMYMGLQDCTHYDELVVATGQQTAIKAYWPKLNEAVNFPTSEHFDQTS